MSYVEQINKYPILSREQQEDLVKLSAGGDIEARKKLICSNLRLVLKIAHRYKNMGVSFKDLVRAGNFGLIEAAMRAKPNMDNCFITFAQVHIKHFIKEELSKMSGVVSLSIGSHGRRKELHDVQEALGEDCTVEQIAEACGKNPRHVRAMLSTGNGRVSLDATIDDDGKRTYLEMLEDEKEEPLPDKLASDELMELMLKHVYQLPEQKKFIIIHRFGIDDEEKMNLRDIGVALSMSAERVRQLQNEALSDLRRLLEKEE